MMEPSEPPADAAVDDNIVDEGCASDLTKSGADVVSLHWLLMYMLQHLWLQSLPSYLHLQCHNLRCDVGLGEREY